jgi:hypothetical protein
MYTLNGTPLPLHLGFTSGDINYPSNWLTLATPEEIAAAGVIEVPDPPPPDPIPPTPEELARALDQALDEYFDETARQHGYDTAVSFRSWSGFPSDYQEEAAEFGAWCASSCETGYAALSSVIDIEGVRKLIDELPPYQGSGIRDQGSGIRDQGSGINP